MKINTDFKGGSYGGAITGSSNDYRNLSTSQEYYDGDTRAISSFSKNSNTLFTGRGEAMTTAA